MRINTKLLLAVASMSLLFTATAQAELNVFACEPEYAALTLALAPDAKVYSATTAMQDPHQVQARPSLIAKMRQADVVVCAGADLEIGWLPMLQMKSANPQVRSTDKGLFFAAEHIDTLDKLVSVDRSMGDVHAKGNPHLHLDPQRMLIVAQALSTKFTQIDPDNASLYRQSLADFSQAWQAKIPQWQQQAKDLAGKKVIAYHSSFRYLFKWIGIEQVADLEPKPGIAPTSSHLASLLTRAEKGDVMAIIVASYQDERGAKWLGERANLPVLVLPISVGGNEESKDLISLYDNILSLLNKVK
ncbi:MULTISPECIES: zinc ABC transporter substrate-binding protein [Shewanella]|uniref:metal ABC transporter solute-binding protein, Zn/Mn family n=1 Tax=Shewanella TaxID=22 RepID=UPI000C500AAA|nr:MULTISPECIES: zinc ABC transporter substrate-binding protein [Shewanella]NCQ45285.1 zinc ABC transporter solute-binding protein [Shewanella frigidimarina]NCO70727.1 zinc ABC transporter solute-binding protein [Shewanella vesiculosa]NCP36844.1 zinc ABC transporter solute-binding protein [Shewanella vesiculosa]NCP69063.1 zinc ABC transporter solute-binding protein [Shewanella vesiculosa]NCP74181.1 zinc ABC transporter solute-binding protein [Shewanella vesiculosa]